LDGWRAISIILVLGAHSNHTAGFPSKWHSVFKWLFDGRLGVRFFFIISGFIITWLMLVEHARNGRVNLHHFYARRALRILPVYGAFLGVLFGLQLFPGYRQSAAAWIGNLTFTTNFVSDNWISGHLWSLAVEEQFYLLWPGLFLLCGAATRWRWTALVLGIPILVAPLFRVLAYTNAYPGFLHPLFRGTSFFYCCDSLAVGCVCAILFDRERKIIQNFFMSRPVTAFLVGLALILIPYLSNRLFSLDNFTVALDDSFQAWGFGILLLQSIINPKFGFYGILNWRWIREIGVLSYSLYIWQQIFCANPKDFGIGNFWWMSFPGWLFSAFTVALISYYGFERPLFRLRGRFRDA